MSLNITEFYLILQIQSQIHNITKKRLEFKLLAVKMQLYGKKCPLLPKKNLIRYMILSQVLKNLLQARCHNLNNLKIIRILIKQYMMNIILECKRFKKKKQNKEKHGFLIKLVIIFMYILILTGIYKSLIKQVYLKKI